LEPGVSEENEEEEDGGWSFGAEVKPTGDTRLNEAKVSGYFRAY